MSGARFTVAASVDGLHSLIVAAQNADLRVIDGFELPAAPWDVREAGVVCAGEIADEQAAEAALVAAVRGAALLLHVRAGQAVADRLIDDLGRLGPLSFDDDLQPSLTPEERRLLTSLAHGGSVAAAARSAHVSRRTIERRLAEARAKLGVDTTIEAVLAASRRGLLGGDVAV